MAFSYALSCLLSKPSDKLKALAIKISKAVFRMTKVMIRAASLSIIGSFKEAAIIAIEVPIEVTASERLSLEAATKALDFTFFDNALLKAYTPRDRKSVV